MWLRVEDWREPKDLRQAGYAVSQRFRRRIEEVFGWMKTVGSFRPTRFRGFGANPIAAYMIGAAYNLLRVARLLAAPPLATGWRSG